MNYTSGGTGGGIAVVKTANGNISDIGSLPFLFSLSY